MCASCSLLCLQEPSGPEAEAAMAGLEVEARCYKHVQDYTLDELVAALEHLESQQAAGEGLGSWSDEQLEALRSEVARKRAAEALTRMGDRALDALTRKVNSYTSSAEGSPFGDMRRQLIEGSSRDASMLDTPAAAAALASAAAAGLASWLVAEEEAQQKATAGFHRYLCQWLLQGSVPSPKMQACLALQQLLLCIHNSHDTVTLDKTMA